MKSSAFLKSILHPIETTFALADVLTFIKRKKTCTLGLKKGGKRFQPYNYHFACESCNFFYMTVEVEVAQNSTFCPGVERAIKIVEGELSGSRKTIYTVGPIIHNPEVVKRLESLGLKVLDPDAQPLSNLEGATVIVRSHGIDLATENKLKETGALIVDATCQNVKRAQKAAKELEDEGFHLIIVGSANHPEVVSILGRLDKEATVIENPEQAIKWINENQGILEKLGVVAQTTISRDLLQSVADSLRGKCKEMKVRDTRCESVTRRQNEALEMCRRVDLMVVVGGLNSSNTARLADLCRKTSMKTVHVEDPKEIDKETISGAKRIGVIGGASTPDWQIEDTVSKIKSLVSG